MKRAFLWILRPISLLWQTLVRMFVSKKHIYRQDVDSDGVEEIVLDFNGLEENDKTGKGETGYDR